MTRSDRRARRICLAASGCVRLTTGSVCLVHRWAPTIDDPLSEAVQARGFAPWWEAVQLRLEQLDTADDRNWATRRASWRRDQAIEDEARALRELAREDLVEQAVRLWREQSGAPAWRLPPAGWIHTHLRKQFPSLRYEQGSVRIRQRSLPNRTQDLLHTAFDMRALYDYVARAQLERKDPARPPFQPITERRMVDEDLLRRLEAQEVANLPALHRHKAVIQRFKRSVTPDVQAVFDDPAIDSALDDQVVVYHQMGVRRETTRLDRIQNQAFRAHLDLAVGDVVHYDHPRSSTLKVWWFGNLGNHPRPKWLHERQHGLDENGLRLELQPRRGIYIGPRTAQELDAGSGGELEVMLPAGTTWEVVGIRDVVQSDSRDPARITSERMRAVQMVELAPDDPRSSNARTMTVPTDPQDHYIYLTD